MILQPTKAPIIIKRLQLKVFVNCQQVKTDGAIIKEMIKDAEIKTNRVMTGVAYDDQNEIVEDLDEFIRTTDVNRKLYFDSCALLDHLIL